MIDQAANQFADHYAQREHDRWAQADICAAVSIVPGGLVKLKEELEEQHGISMSIQTLRNYARVSNSFAQEHRHYQYNFGYFLECSMWDDPVKAMEMALDGDEEGCYSPSDMRNWRLYGEPRPKREKLCARCGGPLTEAHKVCGECFEGNG